MNRIVRRSLKVTVVGDGNVGKTCLLISQTQSAFPEEYVPTVFDTHASKINVDGVEFSLTMWDTAGQEEYEKLRPLSYPKTDCFIVCYAVNNRSSYLNVESKWMPELKHYCPKTACILVGTKSDVKTQAKDPISFHEGKKMKSKIKAHAFLECSAKTRENLNDVFVEAVRSVMKNRDKPICRFL